MCLGLVYDTPEEFIALQDGSRFVSQNILFVIGVVLLGVAPPGGDEGPINDDIDIGQTWMPADDPNFAFCHFLLSWWRN